MQKRFFWVLYPKFHQIFFSRQVCICCNLPHRISWSTATSSASVSIFFRGRRWNSPVSSIFFTKQLFRVGRKSLCKGSIVHKLSSCWKDIRVPVPAIVNRVQHCCWSRLIAIGLFVLCLAHNIPSKIEINVHHTRPIQIGDIVGRFFQSPFLFEHPACKVGSHAHAIDALKDVRHARQIGIPQADHCICHIARRNNVIII